MHRIDGPGATVDNKFTDGDPVGGIQATIVTDDWLNEMQEELMSILAAASIAPVKGTQNQVLKAIRSLGVGSVGAASNVRMSVNIVSASAPLTADQIVVGTALGGQIYRLTGFNKTINLATTGAGGMDVGAAPVNGYVALYAIYNPTTDVSALLAVNATSAAVPNIYGGANMPAGYTASALLTVVPTQAAGQFKIAIVSGRNVGIPITSAFTTSTAVTTSIVSIAPVVPPNAIEISGTIQLSASTASNLGISVSGNTNGVGHQNVSLSNMVTGQSILSSFSDVPVAVPQQMVVTATVTAGSPSISANISRYRI